MLVRQVAGDLPSVIPLVCNTVVLGRDARECDYCLNTSDDTNVISRCHAKLVRAPQSHPAPPLYQIISLGSNGLSVNGQRRSECLLQDGDEVVFAPSHRPYELQYRFYATNESAFAAATPRSHVPVKHNGLQSPSDRAATPTAAAAYAGVPTTVANHYSAMSAYLSGDVAAANHYSAMPADVPVTVQPQSSPGSAATDGAMMYDRLDEQHLDYSRYMLHSSAAPASIAIGQHSARPASATSTAMYTPLTYNPVPPLSTAPPPPPTLRHQTTTPLSPSSTDPPPSTWNTRFQSALDLDESTPAATLHKYSTLSTLSSDFVSLAKLYGRTIIEEFFLQPSQQRTIQQSSGMGGLAGGRKYVVRGILFKLCSDVRLSSSDASGRWLYGGDECDYESANKVGSHELKSAIRYFAFHSGGLRVPMLALVEYLGYRLLAMPILPLPSAVPPLLGSSDAGRTVFASEEELNSLMRSAAAELHLAAHTVNGVEMYTAGDVEGHRGEDGRYYILDLARSFPPENPATSKQPQAALFRLLRPELLQLLKADGEPPLSSDAYTRWGVEAADVHNARADAATHLLHELYLKALARKWMSSEKSDVDRLLADDDTAMEGSEVTRSLSSQPATFAPDEELSVEGEDVRLLRLSEELHCHGLNMRHLGMLRQHILAEYGGSEHAASVGLLLLVEVVSRTLKSLLRRRLRSCVEKVTSVSASAEYDCVKCAVDFLNLCTASHTQSAAFWSGEVETALRLRFGDSCLQPHESTHLFALVSPHLLRVLSYLCMACGVALSPACEDGLSSGALRYVFTVVDVELRVQSRSMAIIDYAEARVMQAQAAVFAQEADAAEDRANQALTHERAANGLQKAQLHTDFSPEAASTTAEPAHLRSTALRLLSLAVQIFDRLRHSDPFDTSYKRQARQCKQQLQQLQEQHAAAHDDTGSQPDSLQIIDSMPLSQSSHSYLHPPTASSTAGPNQISYPHPTHSIRTGLSTAFQRFALQPPIASQSITRSGSSLHGHSLGSQQPLLSSQPSHASLLFSLSPPAASASQAASTAESIAPFHATPAESSLQPPSTLLARSAAMAGGSRSTMVEQVNGGLNDGGATAMETEEKEHEYESGSLPTTDATSTGRGGRRRVVRDTRRPTAAVRRRSNEDTTTAGSEQGDAAVEDTSRQQSLAVNRPRRTVTRNAAKVADSKSVANPQESTFEHILTAPRKRRK